LVRSIQSLNQPELIHGKNVMNQKEFKALYTGEWKSDTEVFDCVDFLKTQSSEIIRQAKRERWFRPEALRAARQIIEKEDSTGSNAPMEAS